MNKLCKKRTALKGRVLHLKTLVDGHPAAPLNEEDVEVQLEKVARLIRENDDLYDSIVTQCKDEADIQVHEPMYTEEDTRLHQIKSNLNTIKKTLKAAAPQQVKQHNDIRLPKLELPTFDGDLQKWTTFKDLFETAVHNSTSLSEAQKLQYLKSALKSEPALLLQSINVTNDNYAEAWTILNHRYENKREIVKSHLDRLLSQPNIVQEAPAVLRKLVDTTGECMRALQVLKIPPEQIGDIIVIHIITRKLDTESRLQWERSLKHDQLPTFKEFIEFLDHHVRITIAAGVTKSKSVPLPKPTESRNVKSASTTVHQGSVMPKCSICAKDHYVYKCEQFLNSNVSDRLILVKKHSLCFNCLQQNHFSNQCKAGNCKTCNLRHHTLLHYTKEPKEPKEQKETATTGPQPALETMFSRRGQGLPHVLLNTALVIVKDSQNVEHTCRVLLDNGSQPSIITENCAQKLNLKRHRVTAPITGLGAAGVGTSQTLVHVQLFSKINTFSIDIDALVLPKITGKLPHHPLNYSTWTHLNKLQLADPYFHEPSEIDILVGNDVYGEIIRGRKVRGPKGAPLALETELGWIVGGKCDNEKTNMVSIHHVKCDFSDTLKQFWEIEEIPRKQLFTAEEKACEEHFDSTHSRDSEGKYTVKLPFKAKKQPLGDSKRTALQRFKQLERRFSVNPEKRSQYSAVIQEYLDLGHMEPVPECEIIDDTKEIYYLPHHGVFKESSSTTKLRVVFDGSAASTSGVSLNDNLMVGPKLQHDLITILMRFRIHKVAFTADIAKMFRQFKVHRDNVDLQRIVWRDSPNDPIKDFRLLTATFGTACAPYLSVKCVQQLAKDEREEFPEASAVLLRDLYVDDLMSGAESEEKAQHLKEELLQVMEKGKLGLRKWSSNSSKLLESLPPNLRESNLPLRIDVDEKVKALGLQWNPAMDCFSFTVKVSPTDNPTKRIVASENAKLFDPLGWLSPVTIRSKLLLQEIWRNNLDWDTPLPKSLHERWTKHLQDFPLLENIKIGRCMSKTNMDLDSEVVKYHLHGFSDASEEAYSAAVYLQTVCGNSITVKLVAGKTKVAPLKQQSLPRLELCGAVLLARLIECVRESLNLPFETINGWTDSTIVLAWLASPPQRWKTFVANRVSEIQDILPSERWKHVRSEHNPADCASRGISPEDLAEHPLWWSGPQWLCSGNLPVSTLGDIPTEDIYKEERVEIVVGLVKADMSLLHKFSSLFKLIRATAHWRRLIRKLKNKLLVKKGRKEEQVEENTGVLKLEELNNSLLHWIRTVQSIEFAGEIHAIKNKKSFPTKSRIQSLCPFVDGVGVLRVGGRLKNSSFSNDRKHPILLPKKHFLTELIVSYYHLINLHAGPQLLLASLQQKFWILSGRDVVRLFVRKCIVCFRQRAEVSQQMMGDLPSARVNPGRAFQKCGVDSAGPFMITRIKGRGQKTFKAYICLFICFTTRAIHIELVTDMTSEAFLAALQRFVSRRGMCTEIRSDCGTNFVGANNEMKEWLRLMETEEFNEKVSNFSTSKGMVWKFNPSGSPHMGGIWEAGVKSVKFHLKRIIGNSSLSIEEMITVLAQVEACLNSRPLTAISSDPNDLSVLTPGHFLIGDALTAVPQPDLTHIKENRLSRWQRTQQIYQHFWKRWSTEYLSRLQQRPKWWIQKENIKIGDLVLIKDENLPPLKWNLGRIVKTHPGKDDIVRVVTVKTATGEYQRPIAKLCLLPLDKD